MHERVGRRAFEARKASGWHTTLMNRSQTLRTLACYTAIISRMPGGRPIQHLHQNDCDWS
jgi:hypothetical protein